MTLSILSMLYSNQELKLALKKFLSDQISLLTNPPHLSVVQVGNHLPSDTYVQIKSRVGKDLGIDVNVLKLDSLDSDRWKRIIQENLHTQSGLICQLPLPADRSHLISEIPWSIDVDLLGCEISKLEAIGFLPPTVGAIDLVLKEMIWGKRNSIQDLIDKKLDLTGKVVAIVGQGKLVGSPLSRYCIERGASLISINEFTPQPHVLTRSADILISAAGKPGLITHEWLKDSAYVIDAATAESEGVLKGDVDVNLASIHYLCPSPRGIGSITVLYLFYNLFRLSKLTAERLEHTKN
jgi:methylenetetrahydrofolate dehydrogenase (NADP+)/methenyltetrahydrofolate cyclohydrolase